MQTVLIRLLAVVMVVGLTSGCATVIKGRSQTVPVNSDPPGAEIIVNHAPMGVTPAQLELRRKDDHLITLEKTGYAPASVPIVKSVGGAVWGNILAGGLIGWGVDATTGAQYNLKPETVFVRLRPLADGEIPPEEDATAKGIARLRELDQALEDGLISEEEYGKGREQAIRKYMPEMLDESQG